MRGRKFNPVRHCPRRGPGRVQPIVHLLILRRPRRHGRGEFFDGASLPRRPGAEIQMLPGAGRLERFYLATLFEKLVEQRRVHRFVWLGLRLALARHARPNRETLLHLLCYEADGCVIIGRYIARKFFRIAGHLMLAAVVF